MEKIESVLGALLEGFYLFTFAVCIKLPVAIVENILKYLFSEYKKFP